MNLREQEYMCAIAKLGSISRAADSLHISQPSLSQFVQRIEREIGYEIFDRRRKILTLTPEGVEYIRACSEILLAERNLRHRIDDISNLVSGKVVVGVTAQRSRYILPDLLRSFIAQYPNVTISIRETLTTDELEILTLRGELDLFFSTLPFRNIGLGAEHILDDSLFLAIPSSIKIPFANNICSEEQFSSFLCSMAGINFILAPQGMKLGRLSYKLFQDIGFMPKLFFETTNSDTALAMVSCGLGATFVFRSAASCLNTYEHTISYIPVPHREYIIPLIIGFANEGYLSKSARAFITTSKKLNFT